MAVMAMMGTREYIRVVSTAGFAVTGLFVAMATQSTVQLLKLKQLCFKEQQHGSSSDFTRDMLLRNRLV